MQSWKLYMWLSSHSTDQQLTRSKPNVSPLSFWGTCTIKRFQNVCPVGFRNVLHFRNCCVSFILPPFHWEWLLQLHSSCSISVYSMESALQGAEVRAHPSLPRTDPARSNPCCWVNIWTSKQNFRSDFLKLFFFFLNCSPDYINTKRKKGKRKGKNESLKMSFIALLCFTPGQANN